MRIISKRRAMTIYRQHPASRIFRYCTGRYQWHGSICYYAGRQDRHGCYACLLAVGRLC